MSGGRRYKSPPVGGTQMPLFTPPSDWQPPTSLPDLRQHKTVALDTETRDEGLANDRGPAWPQRAGHLCGISLAWGSTDSLYVPLRHQDTECFSPDQVARWLHDHSAVRFVMHNAHYDVGWVRADLGIRLDSVHDTQCAAIMLDERRLSTALDALAHEEGLPGKDESQLKEALSVYGYRSSGDGWKRELWRLPARYVAPYACQDARTTLDLHTLYAPRIAADGVEQAYETEMALVPCVHEMRWRGVRVDVELAAQRADQLRQQRDAALAELGRRLGRRVGIEDVSRNRWLEEVFTDQGVAYPRTTPTRMFPAGQPSFTAGALGWMPRHPHWLPQLVVRAEKAHKAARDFLDRYIVGYAHRGRLHASVNQYRGTEEDGDAVQGTRTHRFSYSDPPLQQMPKRDEAAAELIRGCFLPEEDERWCRIDYSQQEYRLIVHFAEMLGLSRASDAGDQYRRNPDTDYHQLMADLTGLDRKPAKDANFANAYGAGVKKFATMTNRSLEEAQQIMDQVNSGAPFVRELGATAQRAAARRGHIKLLDGARLHWCDWEPAWRDFGAESEYTQRGGKLGTAPCSLEAARARVAAPDHPWKGRLRRAYVHKAGNGLIQGSAARQTKAAMLLCWREGIVPLLQLHDELNASFGSAERGECMAEIMRTAVRLTVPMEATPEWGLSWGDAKHKWEEVA